MANVKITALPSATTPLAGTELLELVQGGASTSVTAAAVGNSATAMPFASLAGRAYGSFCDITDQTGSTTAGTAVKFATNLINGHGIEMTTNGAGAYTRITFTAAGTYMIAPNLQLANSDASARDVSIWLAKNGTNIANSNTKITVPKLADGGNLFFQIVFYETVTAGQYIEVFWSPANVAVTLDYTAASAGPPSVPATPSAIVVAQRIA